MGISFSAEDLPTITRHFTTHMQAKKSKANYSAFFLYIWNEVYLLEVQCLIIKGRGRRQGSVFLCMSMDWGGGRGNYISLLFTQDINPPCGIRSLGVTIHHMKPEGNGATRILAVNNWVQLFGTNGSSLSKKLNRRNYPNQMLISQYFPFSSPLLCFMCYLLRRRTCMGGKVCTWGCV